MKRLITLLLVSIMVFGTSCENQKVASKTSNTTSKSVNQVLQEQTDKTNSSQQSNVGKINGGSNLKKTTTKSSKVTNASDIDIDLTRMSSTMVYSEVSNMMSTPENYVGKMVRMNGKLAVYKYPERNYYTCIIKDATACCQQGMEFLWAGDHKYPEDYPNEGDGIIVTGVFDIYYEGESKYVQLKDATLIKARA